MHTARLAVVLAMFALVSCASSTGSVRAPRLASDSKPRVTVSVYPRFSVLSPHGNPITVLVRIEDINEEFYCPRAVFHWGGRGGEISSKESDCVPFHEASNTDKARWSITSQRLMRRRGQIPVIVELYKAGRRIFREQVFFEIS